MQLSVGRVDFSEMTCYFRRGVSELNLMRDYLDRNHAWRMGQTTVQPSAAVCDGFGVKDGYAYILSGWQSFAPMVGFKGIVEIPLNTFVARLSDEAFLWAAGAGGGSLVSCAGVVHSDEFATNRIRAVFMILVGSYFAAWHVESALMRAALGSGSLSCVYGLPHYYFHRMAIGATIGECVLASVNGEYEPKGWTSGMVHPGLMGDLTLRLHPVQPVTNVRGERLSRTTGKPDPNGEFYRVTWDRSAGDQIEKYHIFIADSMSGPWRHTNFGGSTHSFSDMGPFKPGLLYRIHAEKLETTPSGSYYNLSQGVFHTVGGTNPNPNPEPIEPTMSTAKLIPDSTKGGNWIGFRGSDGFVLAGVSGVKMPNYVEAVTRAGHKTYTWTDTTQESRSLQTGKVLRIAAAWHTPSGETSFTVSVKFKDTLPHRLSCYFLDWDRGSRQQKVEVLDSTGAVLDSRTLNNFQEGVWLTWDVTGPVTVRITALSAANAIANAIFFDPVPVPAAPVVPPEVPIADEKYTEIPFSLSSPGDIYVMSSNDGGQTYTQLEASLPGGTVYKFLAKVQD